MGYSYLFKFEFEEILKLAASLESTKQNALKVLAMFFDPLSFQKQPQEEFYKKRGPRPEARNFIKKEARTQVFLCEFCEISKNTFFTETLWTTTSECLATIYCKL